LFGEGAGRALAYAIAGHHAGLPDWTGGPGALRSRLETAGQRKLLERARAGGLPDDLVQAVRPPIDPDYVREPARQAFWIRMLFSTLVDADFLDTEAYFEPEQAALRSRRPSLASLRPALDAHLDRLLAEAPDTPVNRIRRALLDACRRAATLPPGLFTLTAPTGSGKTLASLAFAMEHSERHGLRRVIYVIPYTSIIEQTADVFRTVFGDRGDVVVEHHSNLDPERETLVTRLATENWDAPVIVTTTVQFFESIFAAKPSKCRKLHNVCGSVVILDEAQLLPVGHLRPILWALDELMARYRVSIVLSTATQPALGERAGFPGLRAEAREIVPEPEQWRRALRRVRVERLHDLRRSVEWPELAEMLRAEPKVLVIVDRRDSAQELHAHMPAGTLHLSALMCPAHRSEVLERIRAALQERDAPVRVVSTQLVEAGVDLDFPVVFRAVAGLDSVAQAAGRCNREGLLPQPGRLVLFRAPLEPPAGILRLAAQIATPLLDGEDPLTLANFERYFRALYWSRTGRLDEAGLLEGQRLLARPDGAFAFRTAARAFRIIGQDQIPVLVPYGEGPRLAREIEAAAAAGAGLGRLLRRAQRFVVSVYPKTAAALLAAGAGRELVPGLIELVDRRLYDRDLGLRSRLLIDYDPNELVV
jgi:CRISPR-associated endonuclease/helicase Cas3